MNPSLWRFRCLVLLTSIFVGSLEARAQEGRSIAKPKVVSFPSSESPKELYVAIMGEIARPGTYHVDPSSLKLNFVVERAGGFTADATKYIRVIRQARVSHKQLYSESTDSPLFSGDLLIAESIPSNITTQTSNVTAQRFHEFEPEKTTITATYEVPGAPADVQIALLNVRDYPMILKLRPEESNAAKIIMSLGQPADLLADADIITPDRRMTSTAAKESIRLVQNSVIVVKKDRVNRNRLPTSLPRPIESEIAFGAQSGLIGNPQGQSRELRSLGGRVGSSRPDSFESSSQFSSRTMRDTAVPMPTEFGSPTEDHNSNFAPAVVKSNSRVATIPSFKGSPRITNSSSGSSQSRQTNADPIPEPDDSTNERQAPSESTSAPAALVQNRDASAAALCARQAIIVLLALGILIGGGMVLRRTMASNAQPSIPRTSESIPLISEIIEPVSRGQTQWKPLLDRLVRNELPISMESVEFPQGLSLQGRIAPRPILRVDNPQSILKQNGPHFASLDRSTEDSATQEVTAQVHAPETDSIRKPHFLATEKRAVAKQDEAPANVVDREAIQMCDRSKAPLASKKALFELEKGGRS